MEKVWLEQKYLVEKLSLDNGRTLCIPCHRQTPTYGANARKLIKELRK